MKILYATDIHGNQVLVKKLIKLSKYSSNLIIGGDVCATHFVPIINYGNKIILHKFNLAVELKKKNAIDYKEKLFDLGYISWYGSIRSFENFNKIKYCKEMQAKSLKITLNKLKKHFKNILIILGNDDWSGLEIILNKDKEVVNLNKKVMKLNNYEFVGFSYVPLTPFKTYFELKEREINKKLNKLISKVENYKNSVWVFHSPPYNSDLDLTMIGAVGSKSIRKFIERKQPKLFLCGHIHESAGIINIGKTICINSGSENEINMLRAVLIDLNKMEMNFFRE